ncbi:Ig-like domain-containing protein [Salmonella enterica]|nr:Ig-like domain-containing protein [Salmonella enterica]EJJ4131084.1 Ig-like domain-containing protein [Salmonella enterica]EJJ4542037.1 Ig-like domain-containing protein [Salmonella enterica]EKC2978012.1 Ig-like domain-containing protein [Salmonella enterica]EKC2996251.1 Ig-like domain-containing protein [Salmonella enterica]
MSANELHLYTSTGLLDFEPNNNATIIAELKDSNKKPISGMEIKWSYTADSTDAMVTTSGDSSHTGADGRAEYTISSNKANSISVIATAKCGDFDTIHIGVASDNVTAPVVVDSDIQGIAYQIMIRRHVKGNHAGDKYMVYWDGLAIATVVDDSAQNIFPYVKSIKKNADYLSPGTHYIYYTIEAPGGNISYSPVVSQDVPYDNSTPLYDKPLFPDLLDATVNNHGLSLDKGLLIKIRYPQSKVRQGAAIEAGDTISVYMNMGDPENDAENPDSQPVKIATHTVSKAEISGRDIEFIADESYFIDNINDTFNGVNVFIYYTIGDSNPLYSYSAELYVDTESPGNFIIKLIG